MANEKQKNKNGEEEINLEQPTETSSQSEFEEPLQEEKEEYVEEQPTKKQEKTEIIPKEEFIKLKYQFSEFVNKYKDYEREFENYKRRTREEIKDAKEEGMAKAIKAIFPALDSFKNAKKIITDKSSLSGIALIEKNIFAEFEKLGVKKIKAKGEMFDPDLHNAVMLVEDENVESNIVVEEIETGYTLNDKVIKFSQVIVAK